MARISISSHPGPTGGSRPPVGLIDGASAIPRYLSGGRGRAPWRPNLKPVLALLDQARESHQQLKDAVPLHGLPPPLAWLFSCCYQARSGFNGGP